MDASDGSASPSPLASADVALPTPIPLPVTATSRLRVGLDREPSSLDPALAADDAALVVIDTLFDSLTRMSDDLLEVLPAAASSWQVSDDGLVWTFSLREAQWHDGLPVTAGQFVRAFNTIAANGDGAESFNAHLLSRVVGFDASQSSAVALHGVRAVDPRTLTVEVTQPFADLPAVLSHPALAPRRMGEIDVDRPVGNGPFRMDDPWAHNQFIRVTATTDHRDVPRVGEVVFPIYPGEGSADLQLEDFRAGVLDVAKVPPLEVNGVGTEFGVSADGYTGPGLLDGDGDEAYWIGFNTTFAPFDDPAVRLGISQLLDRDRVIDVYTASSRSRATGIVPGGLPGSQTIDCASCRHDPLAAQRALAGFAERIAGPVRILTLEGVTNRGIADMLAAELRSATGAIVTVEAEPLGQWLADMRGPSLQIFRAGWEASWPTMGGVLAPSFHSSQRGGANLVRLDDAQVDAAIDEAMAMSGDQAIPQWQQVEQQIADLAVVAPVFWHRLNVVVAGQVQGFRMSPTGQVDLSRVSIAG